jgi:hypothetical protein
MCKHVAAALYGVGARLDDKPRLLFVLRGVDENELIAGAGRDLSLTKAVPRAGKVLDDGDVAALFRLEMAEPADSETPNPAAAKTKKPGQSRTPKAVTTAAGKNKGLAAKKSELPRATRTKPGNHQVAVVSVRKRRALLPPPLSHRHVGLPSEIVHPSSSFIAAWRSSATTLNSSSSFISVKTMSARRRANPPQAVSSTRSSGQSCPRCRGR